MPASIHDVARRAGVSISTVSRVLNGTSLVKEDKRRSVLEAADALDYIANPAARSLRSKTTEGIGVLLPFVNGEFFSELLSGMDQAASEHDRLLVISTSHRRSPEFRTAAQSLEKRTDALIVMAPEIDAEGAASLLETSAPVLFLNTPKGTGLSADVLNFDNHAGTLAITRHLIETGHRRIAHVRGPQHAWDASERERGYRDALREAGLSADGLVIEGGYSCEAGHAAAAPLLALKPRPTAVVATNDYCALGLMSALHEAGVAVPDEVSVCGFDGLPSAAFAVPPLTTVRVPIREMGEEAIHRVVARLTGQAGDDRWDRVSDVEVVVRASTRPVGATHPV